MKTRIRELREIYGITRRELAEKTGLSYTALSKWESGVNEISFDKAITLARALHCDVSDLTYGSVNHDPNLERLLHNYRVLGPKGRATIVDMSDTLVEKLGEI